MKTSERKQRAKQRLSEEEDKMWTKEGVGRHLSFWGKFPDKRTEEGFDSNTCSKITQRTVCVNLSVFAFV